MKSLVLARGALFTILSTPFLILIALKDISQLNPVVSLVLCTACFLWYAYGMQVLAFLRIANLVFGRLGLEVAYGINHTLIQTD